MELDEQGGTSFNFTEIGDFTLCYKFGSLTKNTWDSWRLQQWTKAHSMEKPVIPHVEDEWGRLAMLEQ